MIIFIFSSCSRTLLRARKPAVTINFTIRSRRSNLCSGVIRCSFRVEAKLTTYWRQWEIGQDRGEDVESDQNTVRTQSKGAASVTAALRESQQGPNNHWR